MNSILCGFWVLKGDFFECQKRKEFSMDSILCGFWVLKGTYFYVIIEKGLL